MSKLQLMIEDAENRIKWTTKDIEKLTEEIKESVAKEDADQIAMFLPSKCQRLQEMINKRREYAEQARMLKFLEKEEA